MSDLTAAMEAVRRLYPDAWCAEHRGVFWIRTRLQLSTEAIGEGTSRLEAWEDAFARLRAALLRRHEPQWLTNMRSHKWKHQRAGGNPADIESYEWVRFCDVCGIEDTCEDDENFPACVAPVPELKPEVRTECEDCDSSGRCTFVCEQPEVQTGAAQRKRHSTSGSDHHRNKGVTQ
jgi:hypothetical protein